jgi:hypothetical protein
LFSAIVTAFLVDSLAKLQPDEAARTNELLVNLTQIVYLASIGVPLNTTPLPQPVPFVPDSSDVRENVFWSISLTLSVRFDTDSERSSVLIWSFLGLRCRSRRSFSFVHHRSSKDKG